MTVENGLNTGSFLKLADVHQNTYKTLYIPSNSKGTIDAICNGRYYLYYELGSQWDPATSTFRQTIGYYKFDDSLDFSGNEYYDATLQPVAGGTAQTSNVNLEDFPK